MAHAAKIIKKSVSAFPTSGENTPLNYVIDYGFRCRHERKFISVIGCYLITGYSGGATKKPLCGAWKRCRFAPPKVTRRVKSRLSPRNTVKDNFVTKWNQVHEWTCARSLEMRALIHASRPPALLLLHNITRTERRARTENALKCPRNKFWMKAPFVLINTKTEQRVVSLEEGGKVLTISEDYEWQSPFSSWTVT